MNNYNLKKRYKINQIQRMTILNIKRMKLLQLRKPIQNQIDNKKFKKHKRKLNKS